MVKFDKTKILFVLFFDDRWIQDQGDPRGDRRVNSSCIGDATKLDRARSYHFRDQRGHHSVHISHLLCYARGIHRSLFNIIIRI